MSWDESGYCSRCREHLNVCSCRGAVAERRRRARDDEAPAARTRTPHEAAVTRDPRGSVRSVSVARTSDTPDTPDSDIGEDDEQLLAGVRDGTWLTAQQFPPLTYAVDGLIPEGFALVVGPPKAGKSWLALALLLAVASGGVALGVIKAGPPRRVLYLALEDGDRRMQDRCRSLLGPGEHIPAPFHYLTRLQPRA